MTVGETLTSNTLVIKCEELPASVVQWMHVQLVIRSLWVLSRPGCQHSFIEIDHEIFSTIILSLLLIQEGQLSVSGEKMHTILVNCSVEV